jgi:CheY-like chemotaxis protein
MKKILVAEDDFPSRELLAEILLEWGYEVVQATNGVEALALIEQVRPDLVLLDIQMPLLDGFGVIAKIRGDPRSATLPVVAISAYAMRDDKHRIGNAGFDASLSKPLDLGTLRTLLQREFGEPTGASPGEAITKECQTPLR